MKFSDTELLSDAASKAITAVTELNRPNTIEYLREVVHRLVHGDTKVWWCCGGGMCGGEEGGGEFLFRGVWFQGLVGCRAVCYCCLFHT